MKRLIGDRTEEGVDRVMVILEPSHVELRLGWWLRIRKISALVATLKMKNNHNCRTARSIVAVVKVRVMQTKRKSTVQLLIAAATILITTRGTRKEEGDCQWETLQVRRLAYRSSRDKRPLTIHIRDDQVVYNLQAPREVQMPLVIAAVVGANHPFRRKIKRILEAALRLNNNWFSYKSWDSRM